MIYDIHSHHHPATPGTAIVQLTPDAFYPQPGHLYSVGLHPWDIHPDWRTQMAKLLVMALCPQVLLIGEAGIDKKNGNAPLELQMEVFRKHVHLSELTHKPLLIHCVKAIDELLALRKETKATLPWIIHGFRGGIEQWQQLTRAGIHVSIGNRHDAALAQELMPQHLLMESDDLGDIDTTYRLVSEATGVDIPTLAHHVTDNILQIMKDCQR